MAKLITPEGISAKEQLYQHICEQLAELLATERNSIANAANAAAVLYHSLPEVNWVGFYFLHGQELVLGPFQGKPACTRIPVGKGVCGTAVAESKTIVVPDVNQFPGHIACDSASRSEIVVPLLVWGKVHGVIDIDSATVNRFDDHDREGMECVASIFLGSYETGELPDLSDEAAAPLS